MAKEITYPVEGMDCASCERNIEFAVSSLRGVERVKADHKAKTVQVTLDPSASGEDEVRRAIEDMGYTLLE